MRRNKRKKKTRDRKLLVQKLLLCFPAISKQDVENFSRTSTMAQRDKLLNQSRIDLLIEGMTFEKLKIYPYSPPIQIFWAVPQWQAEINVDPTSALDYFYNLGLAK